MKLLGPGIWLEGFELKRLGADIRRNVTLMKLKDESLIIHSTGPFDHKQVSDVHALGNPRWILDSMLDHDTFADQGRAAFPKLEYFGPPGLEKRVDPPVHSLDDPPAEWQGQVEVLKLRGVPSSDEYVFFHKESRTLVVTDLVFNFPDPDSIPLKILSSLGTIGDGHPGLSRRFQVGMRDSEAFKASLQQMLEWDFDNIVVGHGDPILGGAKPKVEALLKKAEWI